MEVVVDHFDQLTDHGIKVIPLWANSKVPMYKRWNQKWDKQQVRRTLRVYPEANIGILLGDIIDVEGDSEHANHLINEAIGIYPHPSYKSSKSIHHLFISHDPKFKIFKKNKIEFRGKDHQSVLPPSQHEGVDYQWIDRFFPIPKIPDTLVDFLERLRKEKNASEVLKKKHGKIWCNLCGNRCFLNQKRLDLEVKAFGFLNLKWECKNCRSFDMRYLCRSIKSEKIY